MAPNTHSMTKDVCGPETVTNIGKLASDYDPTLVKNYNWRHIGSHLIFAVGSLIGLYLVFTSAMIKTSIYAIVLMQLGMMGVAAGSHRLWAHRTYKAKLPLRIILAILQTMSFQMSVYDWARDHRLHHKYCDTNADPYTPHRGIFFSHIGWALVKRHPLSVEMGRKLDLSDLRNDPVVAFQKKHYFKLSALFAFAIPVVIPMYFWGETYWNIVFLNFLRHSLSMHTTFGINSITHTFGYKPYDVTNSSKDVSSLSTFAAGETLHNYHHAFPWDYRSTEIDSLQFNICTWVIDMFAKIGWAYDMKTTSREHVDKRVSRTGMEQFRQIHY